MKQLLLTVVAVFAGAISLQAADKEIQAYQDKSLPAEVRARDLASRLTLDEIRIKNRIARAGGKGAGCPVRGLQSFRETACHVLCVGFPIA